MSREHEGDLIRRIKEDPLWSQAFRGRLLVDIWFTSYKEYNRFVDHVYEQFNGAGLDLSDMPIRTAVMVTPWLLEETRDKFNMRPVTSLDIQKGIQKAREFNAQFEDDGTIFGSEEYIKAALTDPEDDDGM